MSSNGASVLALNFGSASLKAASYSLLANGTVEDLTVRPTGRTSVDSKYTAAAAFEDDAHTLLAEAAQRLPELHDTPDVVAHRIVHGADRPGPAELTQSTLAELAALSRLAPLHQPPALALVQAAIQRWPNARQIGIFDTSWHQTMPEKHRVFPIPYSLYASGVKRYGFHGLAFQSAMRQLRNVAPMLATRRVVLAHLGGGSSLCAVFEGCAVNTTMGMTPLGGIAMASRSGSLDPGVLLHLQRDLGMSPDQIDQLLWRGSGLRGLSGESGDMRKLLASGSEGARRAIDVYVTGVAQAIAGLSACIGGIDLLGFSGGIGAHAAEIRRQVAAELEWLGIEVDPGLNQANATDISTSTAKVKTMILSIDEEAEMAGAIALGEGCTSALRFPTKEA
ncbi:MAG: hypothetical protein A3E01_14345 [Gammaproteobacteria bacterium RIFCSPHIGHO2_12_FULL_63_22]|nr:MAG: hypothetical protein A3E01_14345 [Gammaproteobacteria bacterium RIFCSPHIGHO2_12_FULL_63_22]